MSGEEEATSEVTDDLPVVDFSQWEDQEETTTDSQPETPTEESGGKYPGTWASILEQLPTEFHELVAPELKKWDQGVGQRFEKVRAEAAQAVRDEYKTWERFRASNIDPESLEKSYRITQRIEADPVGFFEDYKALLIQNGQYKEAAQVQEQIDDLETDPNDPVVKQIAELKRQQEEFQQSIEQAAFQAQQQEEQYRIQQMHQEAAQSVEAELSDLESRLGTTLPRSAKLEVLSRTNQLIERGNPNATVEDGYRDMMRFITNANRTRPGASAPRIASASGGSGLPQPTPASLKTADDRLAASEAILAAMSD